MFPHTPRRRTDGGPPDRVDVVIVGAGPAGLVAGITLARYGVGCLVVDRRTGPGPHPRATVVSLRNMELLRSWGLEDEVRRGGEDVEWLLLVCGTLAEAGHGETIDVGYPTKEQSALLSPTSPACVPQDHLETVLLDHLRSSPSVRLQLSVGVEEVCGSTPIGPTSWFVTSPRGRCARSPLGTSSAPTGRAASSASAWASPSAAPSTYERR